MDERYVIILATTTELYGTGLELLLPNTLPRNEAIEYVLKYIKDNKYELYTDTSVENFHVSGFIEAYKGDTIYTFQLSRVSF